MRQFLTAWKRDHKENQDSKPLEFCVKMFLLVSFQSNKTEGWDINKSYVFFRVSTPVRGYKISCDVLFCDGLDFDQFILYTIRKCFYS